MLWGLQKLLQYVHHELKEILKQFLGELLDYIVAPECAMKHPTFGCEQFMPYR